MSVQEYEYCFWSSRELTDAEAHLQAMRGMAQVLAEHHAIGLGDIDIIEEDRVMSEVFKDMVGHEVSLQKSIKIKIIKATTKGITGDDEEHLQRHQ